MDHKFVPRRAHSSRLFPPSLVALVVVRRRERVVEWLQRQMLLYLVGREPATRKGPESWPVGQRPAEGSSGVELRWPVGQFASWLASERRI